MSKNVKGIKDRDTASLKTDLLDKQKHMFVLRGQSVTEKLEDPSQIVKARKDIARIKTILRQRELEDAKK